MAEMNKNEEPPQTLKCRPRPEIQRPIIPPPGGLPMPPSRQENVTQSRRSPLPQSHQEVDQSSRALSRSGTTTSNIPTPDTLPTPSEKPQLSGTMPIDMFGLPDFRFPIMPTSNTEFGMPPTVFSSIKSPTHLPKLANIKVTNPFGSPSARSGILGSNLPSALQLHRPLNARSSRNLTTRDLLEISSSSESTSKDLPTRANRHTDLSFFKESSASLSSDPGPNKHGTSSNILSSSKTFKESHKSSNFIWTSDRAPETNFKSTPMSDPSDVESNLGNVSGASAMNIPMTSASVHSPGPSSIAASSDSYDPQGKLNVKRSSDPMPDGLPGPSKIRGTGDSMPSISQHPDAPSKSKSLYGKFMRFVRKGLNVKKTRSRLEDKEESTGLVFEREEGEQELRPQPSHREPERERKYIEVDLFGKWLKREPPVFPYTEVEKKCYTCNNFTIGSPTVSVLSNTSTSKSEPDLTSIGNPAFQALEPISKSNPTSPSTERKCTCNSASETSESASTSSPIPGISDSPISNSEPEIS